MIHYLSTCDNESVDIIVCIASFQHLPDSWSRKDFLNNVYRILHYDGYFFSVDRSRSLRMVQKHGKLVIDSIKKYITTLWKWERNNIMIPFSNKWNDKLLRLYHIFTIVELKKLFSKHWFLHWTFIYSGQDWSFHHNILKARNICSFVQKKIFF
jgi:SAM-dependent methyltransferase